MAVATGTVHKATVESAIVLLLVDAFCLACMHSVLDCAEHQNDNQYEGIKTCSYKELCDW